MKNATLLSALCMLLHAYSFSQAGTLDSSFGDDGKIVARISRYCSASAVAIEPDGGILVAGTSNHDFLLLRYKKNGGLDKTFGQQGIVLTDFGGNTDVARSIVLQANGKIILAGITAAGTASDFALARYEQDGTLDSSFGLNGKVVTDFGGYESGNSVAVQTDGKIVVAGTIGITSASNFVLIRYKKNGWLDSSFGVQGKVVTDFLGFDDHAYSLAIQANGKIVAAGVAYVRQSQYVETYFALARYSDDGVLDDSFGDGGKALTDFGGYSDASSVTIQEDGKIIAVGAPKDVAIALARYRHDGRLDSSFDKNGKLVTRFAVGCTATDVAVQTDGKILVAGGYYQSFALLRYKPNGALDKTFGAAGLTTTSFSGVAISIARSLAVQANGKIVVVGQVYDYDFSFVAIARYNGDNTSTPVAIINSTGAQKNGNAIANIVLSPNPVKDILHVDLRANITGSSLTKTVSIFDANGKLLQQVTTASRSYSFDVKQLPAGVYLVRISDGQTSKTLKFLRE